LLPKNKKPACAFRASGLMSAGYFRSISHTAAGTISRDGDGYDVLAAGS
jgi:hypothetical protein